MVCINNYYFLKDVNVAKEGNIYHNMQGESLTLQIEGDAAAFTLQILGCSDMASEEYHVLSGLDTAYNLLDTFTTNGIYVFGIDGIGKIKVVLSEIGGGKLSAFGKMTKGV